MSRCEGTNTCAGTWLLKLALILLYLKQANLKADWSTKPLLQRCQELVKVIDDYPAKVQHSAIIAVKMFNLLNSLPLKF